MKNPFVQAVMQAQLTQNLMAALSMAVKRAKKRNTRMPHQSEREQARRLSQMSRGQLRAANGVVFPHHPDYTRLSEQAVKVDNPKEQKR